MSRIKTAISIEESIFNEVKEFAKKMKKSRSELVTTAISRYIEYLKNRKLFEEINAAYDDMPDESERNYQQAMKAKYLRTLEDEKW